MLGVDQQTTKDAKSKKGKTDNSKGNHKPAIMQGLHEFMNEKAFQDVSTNASNTFNEPHTERDKNITIFDQMKLEPEIDCFKLEFMNDF